MNSKYISNSLWLFITAWSTAIFPVAPAFSSLPASLLEDENIQGNDTHTQALAEYARSSRCRTDAAYDDRMAAILRTAQLLNPAMDYRELVSQNVSTVASHASAANRPTPDEIMANYRFDETLRAGVRNNILIFDDVLTAGSHFKAMKCFLLQHLPDTNIQGLFVARTARDADVTSLFDVLD